MVAARCQRQQRVRRGCRAAHAKDDGSPSALLAFGSIAFVGGMRLRRRKKS
jgi:MYXO-CTERM domain-containing protein